jgi:diaminohydroxyphosphoribosylaminopyrimidine deaminase/5-amino-6-(5-phosphoribosylamino)uracil reductase
MNQSLEFVKLKGENVIPEIVTDLYKRNIQSIIVEGGAQTINSFITAQLWDEARVFESKQIFGSGIKAPVLNSPLTDTNMIGDVLTTYYR